MLRQFVAGRDVSCPACGYSLRDLESDRCPECGEGLVLRVNLVEQKLGLFIACIIGLAVGLGFNATILAWTGVVTLFGGYRLGIDEMASPVVSTAALGGALWSVLVRRSRFRRLDWRSKAGLVALAWAASAVSATLFFLFV